MPSHVHRGLPRPSSHLPTWFYHFYIRQEFATIRAQHLSIYKPFLAHGLNGSERVLPNFTSEQTPVTSSAGEKEGTNELFKYFVL
jgi:hypothetical protein